MTPTRRIALVLCCALVVGGICVVAFPWVVDEFAAQRLDCLDGGAAPPSTTWCNLVTRYPNRIVGLIGGLSVAALVVLAVLAGRWCLQPFRTLRGVVDQMGPTNLGYRLRQPDTRGPLGQLAASLDAMMDRIAAGYESQRRFAANASHELRTPLAVQRTLIEVGLAEAPTGERLALLTEQLLETNQRNERLIEGLLTLAESEQTPVGHGPQRLDKIAADVVRTYRSRAQARDVDLRLVSVPSTVQGERVLLERLVTNLVQNAIAYNVAHGTVDVEVRAGSVTVTNTGPEVRHEEVGTLFEPFRRGSGERVGSSEGAGLGLTITRTIAAVHDAVIDATPGPYGGLSIRVDFPEVS